MEARMLHQEMTGKDMVITSARRPKRPGGSSKHGTGEAMDIRVWHLDSAQNQHRFADELGRRLGEDFDVIVEGPAARDVRYANRPPHIHVEYDPKGRHLNG
jgi:hypothetical protein